MYVWHKYSVALYDRAKLCMHISNSAFRESLRKRRKYFKNTHCTRLFIIIQKKIQLQSLIVFSHADVTPPCAPPYWITANGLYSFLTCKLVKFIKKLTNKSPYMSSWKSSKEGDLPLCILPKREILSESIPRH